MNQLALKIPCVFAPFPATSHAVTLHYTPTDGTLMVRFIDWNCMCENAAASRTAAALGAVVCRTAVRVYLRTRQETLRKVRATRKLAEDDSLLNFLQCYLQSQYNGKHRDGSRLTLHIVSGSSEGLTFKGTLQRKGQRGSIFYFATMPVHIGDKTYTDWRHVLPGHSLSVSDYAWLNTNYPFPQLQLVRMLRYTQQYHKGETRFNREKRVVMRQWQA